ncbi:MAG: IS3 family transposase, partial [Oligoflexales bacterium]
PNKVWLSDITYIPTNHGWVYLAVIMDAHTRKIIGWSLKKHMEKSLVIGALRSALCSLQQKPHGIVLHSDRGSQYASSAYRRILKKYELKQSMSGKGDCWDNAPMESFFDSIKTEHISGEKFDNLADAQSSIFEWIEIFYNRQRLHSSLGYQSPACFESRYMTESA